MLSVFRFCANTRFRNPSNPAASTPNSTNRGAKCSRNTVEYTSGGGLNASGGSVNRLSTLAFIAAVAESKPYSRTPGTAATRSATSRCIISTARPSNPSRPAANSFSRISDVM